MRSVVIHSGDNSESARIDSSSRKIQLDRIITVPAAESVAVLSTPGETRSLVIRNYAASTDDATVRVTLDPANPDLSSIIVDEGGFIQVTGDGYILLEAGEGTAINVRPQKGAALPLWPEVEEFTLTNLGDADAEVRLVVY